MHALDHPAGALSLLGNALGGLLQHGAGFGILFARLHQVQRPGCVAGDGGQRLVQLVAEQRGHLAHGGQPRGGLQTLLLLARNFLDATLVADIEHGAHPAGVQAGTVDQRGLEDQHRKALAILSHEGGLEALARLFGRPFGVEARGLPAGVFVHQLGRPVGRRGQADHRLGVEAHHLAEGRIDIGDAALQVARTQAGDQRIFHRLSKGQRLRQRGFGTGAPAHVARQQQHHHAQRQRQPEHQAHGQVGDQLRTAGRAVQAQLQAQAGQVDDPLRHIDAGTPRQTGAYQPRAVAFDERQLVRAQQVLADGFGEQAAQRQRAHHDAFGPTGVLHRHADVHHFNPQAARQRHEVAARKSRRGLAQRGGTGGGGFKVDLVAPDAGEQRRHEGRVDRFAHLHARVAPFGANQLAPFAHQAGGVGTPLRRARIVPQQCLQALQVARDALANVGSGSAGGRLGLFLRAHAFEIHGQPDQRRLRHHQQHDQGAPQQGAPEPPGPAQRGRIRSGDHIDSGWSIHGGRCRARGVGPVLRRPARRSYAVSRMVAPAARDTLAPARQALLGSGTPTIFRPSAFETSP